METFTHWIDTIYGYLHPQSHSSGTAVPIDFLIYLSCFSIGLLFTLFSAALGHMFGHGGGHVDAAHSHPSDFHTGAGDMPGMSFFSPTILASFLTAFGGFGLIFSQIQVTRPPWVSAPLSIVCGLIMALLVFWMFESFFSKTQSSSESKVASVVGQLATVITPIPEQGVGEIAYVQNGTRYTAPAREENGQPVKNGDSVKVTKVVSTQFYVTKA